MINRRRLLRTSAALALLPLLEHLAMSRAASAGPPMTTKAAGYRVPLESDRHERTFMQWPSRSKIYGSQRNLDAVRSKVALIAQTIARFEPVVVLARTEQREAAGRTLGPSIEVWPIATEDLWCRDSGPTFVVSKSGNALAIADLGFNGWGNKQSYADDGLIAKRVGKRLGLNVYSNGLVGEAGGVEV